MSTVKDGYVRAEYRRALSRIDPYHLAMLLLHPNSNMGYKFLSAAQKDKTLVQRLAMYVMKDTTLMRFVHPRDDGYKEYSGVSLQERQDLNTLELYYAMQGAWYNSPESRDIQPSTTFMKNN